MKHLIKQHVIYARTRLADIGERHNINERLAAFRERVDTGLAKATLRLVELKEQLDDDPRAQVALGAVLECGEILSVGLATRGAINSANKYWDERIPKISLWHATLLGQSVRSAAKVVVLDRKLNVKVILDDRQSQR